MTADPRALIAEAREHRASENGVDCRVCSWEWPCLEARLAAALEQEAESKTQLLEHERSLRLAAERRAAERERERDRLATDALIALASAHVGTPVEGYIEAPWCLKGDIERLAKERDDWKRIVDQNLTASEETVAGLARDLAAAERRVAELERERDRAKRVEPI